MTKRFALDQINAAEPVVPCGQVTRLLPTFIEADGPSAPLGALCEVETLDEHQPLLAEVVSVGQTFVRLAALTQGAGSFPGAIVRARTERDLAPVGDAFLGRSVDGLGRAMDGNGPIRAQAWIPLTGQASSPHDRISPSKPAFTGVRAIDALLTLGEGQRIGVLAAAGVGKTVLVTQLANQTQADRCVLCLVGERGREVEALWSSGLSERTKARSVLVAATSDQNAALRVRAASYAASLAEYWRSQGCHVLLIMDSATRLAMALREVGLAAGEPPTTRAYTPSVFAAIPRLVERFGARRAQGAITAVMTVLCESDETDDPIAELMKSLLDGHVILSRSLAERGQFPAIDIPRSISRTASRLSEPGHRSASAAIASAISTHQDARTLIETGLYVRGSDPDIDRAIALKPRIQAFLRQTPDEIAPYAESIRALEALAKEAV